MALGERRVGVFRALLAAHGQMMVNRTRRGLGRRGIYGLVGVVLFLVAAATPLFATAGFLGYLFGRAVDEPIVAPLMGGVLTVATFGFGVLGGLLGSARQLTWEAYRSFPIPFRTLFFAETFASLGDLVVLGFLGVCLALSGAFVWEAPGSFPLVVILIAQLVLWVVFTQHLIGALAVSAVQRFRRAVIALVIAAWAGLSVVAGAARELKDDLRGPEVLRVKALWHAVRPAVNALPPVVAVRGITEADAGHFARAARLTLPMLAMTLVLGLMSYLLLARETRPSTPTRDDSPSGDRLFRGEGSALWTVARLHIRYLLTSLQGRFGLVVPLITVVLVKGPLGAAGIGPELTLPGSVVYLSLAGTQFHFNQFGLDGQGAKSLFLLPVRTRDVLLGKGLALAFYAGIQNVVLLVLVSFALRPSLADIAAATALSACLAIAHVLEGHWISSLYPRPMAMHRMNSTGLSSANLLPLGVGMLNGAAFAAIYALSTWQAPALRGPGLALLLLALAIAYWRLLPRAARFVDAHRERLVEVLG